MLNTRILNLIVSCASLVPLVALTAAGQSVKDPKNYLSRYCFDCHGERIQKAERRFDQLILPVTTIEDLHALQDIIDQLNLGEMPPSTAKQPGIAERDALILALRAEATDAGSKLGSIGRRTVLRRLNRREYINSVADLFALDIRGFDSTANFPIDQVLEQMDNLGDVLQTSGCLLDQYVEAADMVVEKVFAQTTIPVEQRWTFDKIIYPLEAWNMLIKLSSYVFFACMTFPILNIMRGVYSHTWF